MNDYTVNDFERDIVTLVHKSIGLYNSAAVNGDESVNKFFDELKAKGLSEVYKALSEIEV